MATEELKLTSQWTQITDGTQSKSFQVISGTVLMRDDQSQPAANAPGHTVTGWMTISPPTKCWLRSSSTSTTVTVIVS